jgi:hypothetical protein
MTSKTAKTVSIIATYYHKTNGKLNGTVTYLVRASNGVDTYTTTLVDGKATGCSCPSKVKCYHKKQLEQKTQERKEVASQFAAKNAPSWLVDMVRSGQVVAPKQVVSKPAQVVESPKVVDISTKGNFGSKGFSLLKQAV